MRAILLFFTIISFFIFSCNPERSMKDRKAELGKLIIAYYEALSKSDIQGLSNLTAPNFVMYDEGKIYTNETAVEMVRNLPAFSAKFQLHNANAHIGKQNASMYYEREAQFTMGDSTYPSTRFLESATFMKLDDEWKIRFIHSTVKK